MVDTKQKIQIFQNEEFGNLTTITISDDVWFIGKEVAEKLGYANTKDALKKHIDTSDKQVFLRSQIATLENVPNRGLTCINESGLYSLILSSKLQSAKKFKHWVTSEVLPTIRKHGAYMTDETLEKALCSPDFLIKLATQLKEEQQKRREAEQRNTELTATNTALSDKANTWDFSAIINALIRNYANKNCRNNYKMAFGVFYKQVLYKLHIDLKHRRAVSGKEKDKLISFFKEYEYPSAIKVATAMCHEAGLDTGKIINEVNERNYDDVRYTITAKGMEYCS